MSSGKYKCYEKIVEVDTYIKSNTPTYIMNQGKQNSIPNNWYTFVGEEYDNHYLSNVGWGVTNSSQPGYRIFFSKENMDHLYNTIHTKLKKQGYNIVVTHKVIGGVMSDILRTHTPEIGDVYDIYQIPADTIRNDVKNMNDRVINVIVSTIIDEEESKRWNESLSVWDTVLGDFNRQGLRAHSIIRKKENDYMKGQFNLNY